MIIRDEFNHACRMSQSVFIDYLDSHALTLHFIDEILKGHREHSNTFVDHSIVIDLQVNHVGGLAAERTQRSTDREVAR